MPVNPISLDKIEPRIIQQIENKTIEKVVHEINEIEIRNEVESKKRRKFDKNIQKKASKKLIYLLSKDNIKADCKVLDDRVNIILYNSKGDIITSMYVIDLQKLLDKLSVNDGVLFDKRV